MKKKALLTSAIEACAHAVHPFAWRSSGAIVIQGDNHDHNGCIDPRKSGFEYRDGRGEACRSSASGGASLHLSLKRSLQLPCLRGEGGPAEPTMVRGVGRGHEDSPIGGDTGGSLKKDREGCGELELLVREGASTQRTAVLDHEEQVDLRRLLSALVLPSRTELPLAHHEDGLRSNETVVREAKLGEGGAERTWSEGDSHVELFTGAQTLRKGRGREAKVWLRIELGFGYYGSPWTEVVSANDTGGIAAGANRSEVEDQRSHLQSRHVECPGMELVVRF